MPDFGKVLRESLKIIEEASKGNTNQGNYTSVTVDLFKNISDKKKVAIAVARADQKKREDATLKAALQLKSSLEVTQKRVMERQTKTLDPKRNEPIKNHNHYDSTNNSMSYGEQQRQLHKQSKSKYIPIMLGLGVVIAVLLAVGLSQ